MATERLFFIYSLENKINGKFYIGLTVNPKRRLYLHSISSNANTVISKAIKKYGINNFSFTIIESWNNKKDAEEAEIFWIKFLSTQVPNGYNISAGGNIPLLGVKKSPESIEKWRSKIVGRKWTEEQKKKLKGRKVSQEQRDKQSLRLKGKKLTWINYNFSEETRRKISESNRGKKRSAEAILKTKIANTGRKRSYHWTLSDETKKKMSDKRKLLYLNPEYKKKHTVSIQGINIGRIATKEARENMSLAQMGRKHKPESINKMKASWVIRKNNKLAVNL